MFLFIVVYVSKCTFCTPNGFYSVFYHICFPNDVHSFAYANGLSRFIAVSVFRVAHRATALHSDKAVESLLS